MSALAVIGILVLSNVGSFLIGLVGRRELRLFRRSRGGPETIDFTRSRIGA